MEKKYVIILSEGKEYLCCHEDGCYYDVSCPMRSFTEGEEDFEIMDSGQNRHGKTYPYHKRKLKLVPGFYPNGWLALSLEVPKTGEAYTVLTVNLEDFPAFGIPDKAFVDINNNPEAMDFSHKIQSCRRYGLQAQERMGGIPDGKTEPSRTVPDITGILRGIRTTINHVTSTINNPIIGVWQNMK